MIEKLFIYYLFLSIAFFIIFIVRELMHWKERQDLYNRIMARDLTEYSNNTKNQRQIKSKRRNYLLKGLEKFSSELSGGDTGGDE
jgi:hypothetical protein